MSASISAFKIALKTVQLDDECAKNTWKSYICTAENTFFKQMKIIAVYTQLKQLRNKARKKFRPEGESNPWPAPGIGKKHCALLKACARVLNAL